MRLATVKEAGRAHWQAVLGVFLSAAAISLLSYAMWPHLQALYQFFPTSSELQQFVTALGIFGPLVLIALQAGQVLLAPIPGHITGIAAGYAYGPLWGTFYALVGLFFGNVIALVIGDRYGRPAVERLVDKETLDRFDGLTTTYGFTPFFILFLLPGVPDDVVVYVAGLSPLDLRRMLVLATIGRLPGLLSLTLAGSSLAEANFTMFGIIVAAIAVVSATALRYQDRFVPDSDQ